MFRKLTNGGMNISSVLIVDDSEADLILNEMAVKDFNPDINVLKAYDGQEALEVLKKCEDKPDLILLDINMPGMNGLEFLETYNTWEERTSVVVMLTSSDQESDKKASLSYDCVKAYLLKPLEDKDFKIFEKI